MEHLNVLMKTSEACPLSCLYCYEGGGNSKKIMDEKTLAKALKLIENRKDAKSTSYIWHGAEPLTAGLDFFKRVREIQESLHRDSVIKNSMQTNGVLLTPELADFFVKEQIHLGFSLDGPKEVHDQTRPYFSGRSSFDKTMKSIEMMRERGQNPGVIAVLSKLSLPHLEDIYQFFKSTGLDFKMNPLIKCGNAEGKMDKLGLTLDERVGAVERLFDMWWFDTTDGHHVHYGNMQTIASAIFTRSGGCCDMLETCQDSFMSIGARGAIYPCSRFSSEEVSYGNIHEIENFEEFLDHPLRQKLLGRFESNTYCKDSCEYNFLCNSGCMHNAYTEGDIMGKDPNCLANQRIYDHVSRRIFEELEKSGAIKTGREKKCQENLESCCV